jgi:hypothetical protein
VAQRGVGLSVVDITPKGMLWIVNGEPWGISILAPILRKIAVMEDVATLEVMTRSENADVNGSVLRPNMPMI